MKYRTIGGDLAEVHPSITAERVIEAVERSITTLDNPGLCLNCGQEAQAASPMLGTTDATTAGSAPSSGPTRSC
jgi:hypothetical protein